MTLCCTTSERFPAAKNVRVATEKMAQKASKTINGPNVGFNNNWRTQLVRALSGVREGPPTADPLSLVGRSFTLGTLPSRTCPSGLVSCPTLTLVTGEAAPPTSEILG
jgi:hypothetical protein